MILIKIYFNILKMVNIISLLDLFGKPVSLYSNSSPKVTTCIGFTLSIISIFLFCLIFYFEACEVFKRESPNVISYKQNFNKNNSTLAITNNTFNFFINLRYNFETEKLFKNLQIVAFYEIKTNNSEFGKFHKSVEFAVCDENDKKNFSSLVNDFEYPHIGINLCPRINFAEIACIENFNSFDFTFFIAGYNDLLHPADKDLNDKIHNGTYYIKSELYFIDSQIDLTNPDSPYIYLIKQFPTTTLRSARIKLEGSEINTQTLFSFNKFEKQSRLSVLADEEKKAGDLIFLAYNISFGQKDMYVYRRTYKTLNSAFANSFALFKLIVWVISIMLSPYYTYFKNTIIINKNFDYGEYCLSRDGVKTDNINNVTNSKLIYTGKLKKLTPGSVLKNVSLLRYFLCRRNNRTKVFYEKAKIVISQYLSVENVFLYLVEYFRFKKFILNDDIVKFDFLGSRLILRSDYGKDELNFNVLTNTGFDKIRNEKIVTQIK
jgi:hypothetical protein